MEFIRKLQQKKKITIPDFPFGQINPTEQDLGLLSRVREANPSNWSDEELNEFIQYIGGSPADSTRVQQ